MVVLGDASREEGGGHVVRVAFAEFNHAFLAHVLRAVQQEHVTGLHAVFYKESCLVAVLREVLNQNSGVDLESQLLDQCKHDGFIVTGRETFSLNEIVKFH